MGAKLKIIVQNFSLVDDHSISYLKIYDGRDSLAPLVATMRGSQYPDTLSTGNEVFMEFNFYEYPPNDPDWYGFRLVYSDNQGMLIFPDNVLLSTPPNRLASSERQI